MAHITKGIAMSVGLRHSKHKILIHIKLWDNLKQALKALLFVCGVSIVKSTVNSVPGVDDIENLPPYGW